MTKYKSCNINYSLEKLLVEMNERLCAINEDTIVTTIKEYEKLKADAERLDFADSILYKKDMDKLNEFLIEGTMTLRQAIDKARNSND